jgi:DNA-binding transcriptional ArsR family regulator
VLLVDVFSALADPVRRDLLVRLADAPLTVNALVEHQQISRPAVSRHLRVLREAGLLTARTSGRERIHEVDRAALQPVRRLLATLDATAPIAAHHLDALGLEVRRTVREGRATAPPETNTHKEETG